MKLIKSYIQYDGNGYTAERKFSQETNDTLSLTASIELTLVPFAMDIEHKEFIIFMIPRKEEANIYLWVYIGLEFDEQEKPAIYQKNRFTAVNDLMQYSKWIVEPMDVSGKYPGSIIRKALSKLQEWPDEEIWEALKAFETRLNDTGGSDHWKRDEEVILKTVNKAKQENKGIMYMY